MKKINRWVSIFVIAAMCMSLMQFASASDLSQSKQGEGEILYYIVQDGERVNSEAYSGTAYAANMNRTSTAKINYTYTIVPDMEDDSKNIVSMEFPWGHNGTQQSIKVSGKVTAYPLSTGSLLWEGMLEGTALADEELFTVVVGFSKLDHEPAIQATATVQAADGAIVDMFVFGEQVLTSGIISDLKAQAGISLGNATPSNAPDMQSGSVYDDVFSWVSSGYFGFQNGSYGGNAIESRLLFSPFTNRCALTIKSNCYTLKNSLSATSAEVAAMSYVLQRDDCSVSQFSTISYVQCQEFAGDVIDSFSGVGLIADLILGALGDIGVPTGTIGALASILGELEGTVSVHNNADSASVDVTFSPFAGADFDEFGQGVPVIFGLQQGSYYTGNGSPYTATVSIDYRAYFPGAGGVPGIGYYTSGDRSYEGLLPVSLPVN